jgi:protein TonB
MRWQFAICPIQQENTMQAVTTRAKCLAIALLATSGLACASEVPAVFDAANCKAEYPKTSLLNEETGVVQMQFLVSAAGKVMESKLEKSSGSRNLDKAAMSAVSNCKFKPGSKDGAPAPTWTKVDYAWTL